MEEILQSAKAHEERVKVRQAQQHQVERNVKQQQQHIQPDTGQKQRPQGPPNKKGSSGNDHNRKQPLSFDELMKLAELNSAGNPKAGQALSSDRPKLPVVAADVPAANVGTVINRLERRPSASNSEQRTRSMLIAPSKVPLTRLANQHHMPNSTAASAIRPPAIPPKAATAVKRTVAKSPFLSDPSSLIKLNTVKRDLRTIEEIQRDLQAKKQTASTTFKNPAIKAAKLTAAIHENSARPTGKSPKSNAAVNATRKPSAVVGEGAAISNSAISGNMLQAKSTASKRSAVKQTPAAIKADRSGDKIRSDRSGNRKPVPTVPDELDERTARTHYSAIIQELFGNNRKRSSGYQEDNDDDDDDDDMEATAEEMQREERRSTRLGRLEDEQEAARERQRQLNGAKRKKLE